MKYSVEKSNAFVNTKIIEPYRSGKLSNLTFAVKDSLDLSDQGTSYGSKPWLASHPVPVRNAFCVDQVLGEGARCVGKTVSDELTCSLDGENYFYGTPLNPKAPDRIPGGSSSGSASAVACELVDFAIGTDCAGSIRVPASHCGVIGIRPSLHRVSESGVLPFAPDCSTVGIFANRLTIVESVLQVLLSSELSSLPAIRNIYLLNDAFAIADQEVQEAIYKILPNAKIKKINLSEIIGSSESLETWLDEVFSYVEGVEIYNSLSSWVEENKPEMGPRIAGFMQELKAMDRAQVRTASLRRERFFRQVRDFVQEGDLFCFPTVATVAPKLKALDDKEKYDDYYQRIMAITSFAGLARLPEISLPVANVDGVPLGLSLAAAHGQDEFLVSAAMQLFPQLR